MRTLPLYHGEPSSSLWAAMLFPDDLKSARAYAASALAPALNDFLASGQEWPKDHQQYYLQSIMLGVPSASEVLSRFKRAALVGETVKALWSLIWGNPEIASWTSAFEVVSKLARRDGVRASRSALHDHMGQFRSVLPYWGAWALRERKTNVGGESGYAGLDEVDALVMEAMNVQDGLLEWSGERGRSDEVFISEDIFRPWHNWSPADTGRFPGIGDVPLTTLPEELLPERKAAGRPRKTLS